MKNHLFIGLGGQGGRSIAELRKVIEQRHKDAAQLKDRKLKWEYLSIDSSSDVWNASKSWKYFGKDVSLADRQKLSLDRLSQAGGLSIRPDISPWIGETSVVDGYLTKNHRIEGANQRRRFGRLLFANNADEIRRACEKQVSLLTESSDNQCWLHVFASLAGGTGSGGIVDLITSLRTQFPNGDTENGFPIFVYLFVTHNEGAASDVGYFYQNQYAALRDLNALICGRLRPNLLGSEHGGAVFEQGDPITNLSLFSSLNSRNVNLSLDNQIRIAAESCFERIHSFATGGLSPHCQKAITGQDIVASFPGEPVKQPERSYRFASSGMRRWEVPSEKITEALSLDLAVSSMNQMLFQNWQDIGGFSDIAIELPEHRLIALRSSLTAIVSKRMLASSKDSLCLNLRKELDKIEKGVLNSDGEQKTLDTLEGKFTEYFNASFQGSGINSYLTNLAANRKSVLKELMTEVDASLTRTWNDVTAPIGLNQIPQVLSSLGLTLREQILTGQDNSTHKNRLATRLIARKQEWPKLTRLSSLFGKRDALLKAHAKDLQSEMTFQLLDLCHAQDVEFQKDFLGEIEKLSSAYLVASRTIHELKSDASSERDEIFGELYNMQNVDGANRYEFEIPALERFRDELQKNKIHQEQAAFAMRSKVVPDGMKLTRFQDEQIRGNLAVNLEVIENDIRLTASERINSIHQEFVASGTISAVLNASLLDRLEQRFTGNDTLLTSETREFVALAASSLLIDQNQIQPAVLLGGQVGVPSMPKRVMVLGIPKHRFAESLKKAFLQVIPAGQAYVTDVYHHDDPTQLRLLVMDYWMAARFSVTVKELGKKYAAASRQNSTNNLHYFCNIDPDGELGNRPDLFLPEPEQLKTKLEADLWLGQRFASPVVVQDENGVFLVAETPDGNQVELIGKSIDAVMMTANIPLMMKVDMQITGVISNLDGPEKARLKTAVRTEEERLLTIHKNTSPEFQRWMVLRQQINSMLN
jgi:hypothetical protein